MLLFFVFGLALAQIEPGCDRWQQVDNRIELNGVPIFDLSSNFLFIGTGNLDISDHRGTFWVNDYTGELKSVLTQGDPESVSKTSKFSISTNFH